MGKARTILWREAFDTFERLILVEGAVRTAELAQLAQSRPDLHAQVLRLIAADSEAQSAAFLSGNPPESSARQLHDEGSTQQAGAIVGPYKLERPLGTGGMGEVWYARRADGLFEAPVALKLLHAHLAAPAIRTRFVREGKILGQLTHPNIAHLLDAGATPAGQLYLAIEYVEGVVLDRWCDEKRLGIAERVRVFLQVCDAVAHAHAHLIVHRDLKPTNILITPEGNIKLLDFGIAKLTESTEGESVQTELTRLGGRVLTPEYAAPEQITGEPVTVATDVYSLGVLLYELLGGVRPYGASGQSRSQLEREVLEIDPLPLSRARAGDGMHQQSLARLRASTPGKLKSQLGGDLDTIVLKALKKASAERYPSVSALAEDLRRYLNHEPVLARPDSFAYRTRKYLRRHRVGVSVAAMALVLSSAGIAGTLWQARAEQRRAQELRQVVDFQGAMLKRLDMPIFGADFFRLMREQLQRRLGQGGLENLPHPEEALATLDNLRPYAGLTDVARDALTADLLKPAGEEMRARLRAQPQSQAALLDSLGGAYIALGLGAPAEALFQEAAQAHVQRGDDAAALTSRYFRALALSLAGKYDESLIEAQAVADARAARYGEDDLGTLKARALQSHGLTAAGDHVKAQAIAERVLAAQTRLLGPEHPDTLETLGYLCVSYLYQSKYDEALPLLKNGVETSTRVLGPTDSTTVGFRLRYADVLNTLDRAAEARAIAESLIKDLQSKYGDDSRAMRGAQTELGNALAGLHDSAGAMRLDRAIYESEVRLNGPDHPDTLVGESNYADDLRNAGQFQEAVARMEDVVARRTKALGAEHVKTLYSMTNLAMMLRLNHELVRSRELGERTLAADLKVLGAEHQNSAFAADELAETYYQLGENAKALALGEQALAGYRKLYGDSHVDVLEQMGRLSAYRRAAGDSVGADALAAEARKLRAAAAPDRNGLK